MFNIESSSNNRLKEIPNNEQQDPKLRNIIIEEKDFFDEMIKKKINKNHIWCQKQRKK